MNVLFLYREFQLLRSRQDIIAATTAMPGLGSAPAASPPPPSAHPRTAPTLVVLYFILFLFLTEPMVRGSSPARNQTHTTATTSATAVAIPGP